MRGPFLVVAAAWFAVMAGSNLATPLYAVYEREFGFSSAVLTIVFATYMLVLAPALLVFGQLSDRFGRRRVMAGGFFTATIGLLAFAVASGLAWLFAARAIQGLAVGMISGAAAAALVELDTAPEEDRAALFTSLAQTGGSGSGPVIAGMLAAWAPSPLVLPFALFIALGLAATVAALAIPEPAKLKRGTVPLYVRCGRVCRPRSARSSPGSASRARWCGAPPRSSCRSSRPTPRTCSTRRTWRCWARSAGRCWRGRASRRSSCAGAAARTRAARRSGWCCSRVGLLALVLAFPLRSLPLLLAAGMLAGTGHGIAFLASQAQLNLAAPPDRRGAVNAAFYTLIYLGVAAAVISTGLLTLAIPLSSAVTSYAAVAATVALATAAWHVMPARAARRARPAPPR